jgi:hypothetical protein
MGASDVDACGVVAAVVAALPDDATSEPPMKRATPMPIRTAGAGSKELLDVVHAAQRGLPTPEQPGEDMRRN